MLLETEVGAGGDGELANATPARDAHRCHAVKCTTEVPPNLLMCQRHWGLVPVALRAQVGSKYRPGQEVRKDPSAEYVRVAARAVAVVAWCEGLDAPTHALSAEPTLRAQLLGAAPAAS